AHPGQQGRGGARGECSVVRWAVRATPTKLAGWCSLSAEPTERPPLRSFLRYFVGLGVWGFGGPIATVGYMQRALAERRACMNRDDFLDGVALGQTMPGPLAAQVAMWVGYLLSGASGALAIAAAFVGPSFLFVLGVAIAYVRYQGLSVVQSLFYGIA